MADVFISYHVGSAGPLVRQIAARLEARGISCWYSEEGVKPGGDFADTVPKEIRSCRVFLLILDRGAAGSDHVRREMALADKANTLILPFQREDCTLSDAMAYYLENVQIMNRPFRPFTDERMEELANYVANFLGEQYDSMEGLSRNTERVTVPTKKRRLWAALVLLVLLIPAVLLATWYFGGDRTVRSLPVPETASDNAGSAEEVSEAVLEIQPTWKTLSAFNHTLGLYEEGVVVVAGFDNYGQCEVTDWTDIVSVSAGWRHSIGLRKDGTVVTAGWNAYDQCEVTDWTDIVAVSAANFHTVGLRKDGTVVAVGLNDDGQCDVTGWTDIAEVSAGDSHTVGLQKDGTVVAVGDNEYGQCDVADWTDIVSVAAGNSHTVGLRKDGTMVAVGSNNYDQCDVADWTDIIAVSAGWRRTVGLRKDGTVVAVGVNDHGQCDVTDWTDIVSVSAGTIHTAGLRSDGTVVAVGYNKDGQCDVSDWTDIQLPTPYLE